MELLLRHDIAHLGKAGDLIKVKPGYARNYLLPKNLAMEISDENRRVIAKEAKARAEKLKKELNAFQVLAKALTDVTVNISMKAAEGGTLYGSVSPLVISEALKKLGHNGVEEGNVRLEAPIKEKGTFPVKIHFHPEAEATISVVVTEEK